MDPIANMLAVIKNALAVNHETVEIPASRLKLEITKILKDEGFIESYQIIDGSKIKIKLKYRDKEPAISEVKKISKPGCRIYTKSKNIPLVLRGLGAVIISTPAGVMTGKEAKKKGLGGEIICKIW